MRTIPRLRTVLLGLALIAASCTNYSSVSEKRPSYKSHTPAGRLIARTLQHPPADPQSEIGSYLDAVAAATSVLEKRPDDRHARRDYNFAVGRIFESIDSSGLEPWKSPLRCPGAGQEWSFSMKEAHPQPGSNPANFNILPADRFEFHGSLVTRRTIKDGLGAPLIATSKEADATQTDPFAQGKRIYYGLTGLVDVQGRICRATLLDPLANETIEFAGHSYPVAADFTAPLAMAIAELNPRYTEIEQMILPDFFASSTRLARLQPYDPKKIPVLFVHGLGDSQATWAPMIETLRGDPIIREHYQFWFFNYPTGYPYPLMAAVLRKKLDAIKDRYPDHKPIVVIGHSMGGMIARTLITDSGMRLWNAYYDKPPREMPFSDETRQILTEALIFQHRPEISRVIFASASHRGSDVATGLFGRLGSTIIGGPTDLPKPTTKVFTLPILPLLTNVSEEAERITNSIDFLDPTHVIVSTLAGLPSKAFSLAMLGPLGEQAKRMPNSIDFLNPKNRFVTTLAELPIAKGIPYHSIIGDRGQGGHLDHTRPESSDGVVPYWSSHIDGAESELIVPSDHWSNRHPLGIAEVRRILILHLVKG